MLPKPNHDSPDETQNLFPCSLHAKQIRDMQQELKEVREAISKPIQDLADSYKRIERALVGDPAYGQEGLAAMVTNLRDRVQVLERWRWILVGAGVAGGYGLDKLF